MTEWLDRNDKPTSHHAEITLKGAPKLVLATYKDGVAQSCVEHDEYFE